MPGGARESACPARHDRAWMLHSLSYHREEIKINPGHGRFLHEDEVLEVILPGMQYIPSA
jgi:hypothetical protein